MPDSAPVRTPMLTVGGAFHQAAMRSGSVVASFIPFGVRGSFPGPGQLALPQLQRPLFALCNGGTGRPRRE